MYKHIYIYITFTVNVGPIIHYCGVCVDKSLVQYLPLWTWWSLDLSPDVYQLYTNTVGSIILSVSINTINNKITMKPCM